MSSAGRKNSKPASASESFASFKAAKKTYCSIDYQIECLNELYNQLMPQNGNRRAGSSSRTQDGSQNSKVLQQLRELKANLRKDYGNPRDIPPLERLKVVVMFDDEKKAFFDIRLRPLSGYPTGYPFFIDDNDKGTIVGISEAIYQEVLKAVQEEEEGRGGNGEGNNSSLNHNNNISHAAEEGLIRVNIKQEVGDDVEVVEVITLEENYNSQVIPPSTDNNAMSGDFRGSASSAAAAAASVAAIPSENGPAVNPQANIDTNSSSSNNNAVQQQQRQQSANGGSTVSQGQSKRQSEAVPIKLEPTDSFTVTVTRVGRSPNRAPRKAPDEAPAPAASSVAVPPVPPANVRVLQVNLRPPNVFPSKSKPQQQLPPSHTNNNGTTTSAQQRQQPPAAAAAVVEERGTLKMKPTEANSSRTYRILDSNNNNKRPADHSNAAQPQGSPKRAKVSASPGTSTQAKTASQAVAEHFLASAAFRNAPETQRLDCPLCVRRYVKAAMEDHLDMWHINRGRYVPYRCTAPGCRYTNIWGMNAREHARQEHGGEQYIVKAAEVVPRTGASLTSSSSSSSAAATAKHLATITTTTTASTTSTPSATTSTSSATTTTATTAATTSTPSAASALQQQQHQQPSTSASTSASTAQRLSAEDYLRAHCPDYVAAKNGRTRVRCSDCSKVMDKYLLKEHFVAVHRGLKPFHCQWPGCSYTSGSRWKAAKHVRDVHKDRSYAQYIVYREE